MAQLNTDLQVRVVAPDGVVWEGAADSVIVRTTEGDVGILRGHVPFLASTVPCAAEILHADGLNRQILLVHDGFVSVSDNRVSLITQFATMADRISLDQAEAELAEAEKQLDKGNVTEEIRRNHRRASAQVKAAQKFAALRGGPRTSD